MVCLSLTTVEAITFNVTYKDGKWERYIDRDDESTTKKLPLNPTKSSFQKRLEESDPLNILNSVLVNCTTSYSDLPVTTQAMILSKTLADAGLTTGISLALLQFLFNSKPFTKDYWVDSTGNPLTRASMGLSLFGMYQLKSAFTDYLKKQTPEYTASQIDQKFLRRLYTENFDGLVKDYFGMWGIISKITTINTQIKTLISQLSTIKKYKNDQSAQIICEKLRTILLVLNSTYAPRDLIIKEALIQSLPYE